MMAPKSGVVVVRSDMAGVGLTTLKLRRASAPPALCDAAEFRRLLHPVAPILIKARAPRGRLRSGLCAAPGLGLQRPSAQSLARLQL